MSITRRLLLILLLAFLVAGLLGHVLNLGETAHATQFETRCVFHTSVFMMEFIHANIGESVSEPVTLLENSPALCLSVKIPHPPTI